MIHLRFKSAWLATALVGIPGVILCLTVLLAMQVNLAGASLAAD